MKTLLPLAFLLVGCSLTSETYTHSDGVRYWGTLREALRDGDTRRRVNVASVADANVYGVGAAENLDGEITIFDGQTFVSRVRDGRVVTDRGGTLPATLLVIAYVSEWHEVLVEQDVPSSELEPYIFSRAEQLEVDTAEPFAFYLTGELRDLSLHVLAGECPTRASHLGVEMSSPPIRVEHASTPGRLVGFYAANSAGTLTHHDSSCHIHALLDKEDLLTGHVDTVALSAGSILHLPKQGPH